MPLPPNTHLGRYEIRSLLGKGGMGEVYLAQDTELERTIALKLLPAGIASDQQRMRRFIQEAKAAATLSHPNIAHIYEIGRVDDISFISMEYVDGETLRQRMTLTRMKLLEALDIAVQAASALAAAHVAGIVHRDVKPENIMLRRDGYIKVLDFGLAKLTDQQSSDSEAATKALVKTDSGVVMGTTRYMSPEQVRGLVVDARTDIWSLGVVLYEIAAGQAPFEGDTASDVIVSILEREPSPLIRYLPEVPTELQRIVRKALRKDREERYQTAKDMALDLKNLRRELELESEQQHFVQPAVSSATRPGSALGTSVETARRTAPNMREAGEARLTSSAEYLISEIKRHKRVSIIGLAALIITSSFIAYWLHKSVGQDRSAGESTESKSSSSATSKNQKLYWQMTQDEQMEFVRQQAQRISIMLGSNPHKLTKQDTDLIKVQLDTFYIARKDSFSPDIFKEGLRPLYSRASLYAPFITKPFKERGLPPVIGIYVALIETECHPCAEGQFGGKGLFGFSPGTALRYGVNANDRCDEKKMAPAAAHYIADLIAEFGSDSESVTLGILSYNIGEDHVRNILHQLLNIGIRERSFWTLAANADKLDESFKQDGVKYVPRFFAAAIIGEGPQAFDLQIQPLSSYE